MLDNDLLSALIAGIPDRAEPRREERRLPLTKGERRRADIQTAWRLVLMGREPFRADARVFEDIEIEPGRLFRPSPYRERWPFAAEGGKRAARLAAEFDLFKNGRDLANIRHFTLRPRPRRPAPGKFWIAKAGLGELEAELKRFSDDYNRWTNKLVTEGLLEPVLTVVHVRFDCALNRWDIHAHCIWMVKPEHVCTVFRRICTKFSKPWYDKQPIKSPAALVNYVTQWVIDYRELRRWPDQALRELWDLNRPRLIRPAAIFADFRRTINGHALVRDGDRISVREKDPPRRRYKAPYTGENRNGVVGYVRVRLDGHKRLCAVWLAEPGIATDRAGAGLALPARPATPAQEDLHTPGEEYSTTSAGLTPLPMGARGQAVSTCRSADARADTPTVLNVPRRHHWWWKAWPYGGLRPGTVPRYPTRIPGPIRRRLARLLKPPAGARKLYPRPRP